MFLEVGGAGTGGNGSATVAAVLVELESVRTRTKERTNCVVANLRTSRHIRITFVYVCKNERGMCERLDMGKSVGWWNS